MRTPSYFGFFGTVCLQVSAIPGIIQAVQTGESAPVATLLLIIIGLATCMVQEIHVKLWAYVAGSVIGIIGNSAILAVLYWK